MASSSSSKQCPIVGAGILCVILGSSPALAAPGIGEGSDAPTVGTLIRETAADLFGFLGRLAWVSGTNDSSLRPSLRLTSESREGDPPSLHSDDGDLDAQDSPGLGGGDPGPVGG